MISDELHPDFAYKSPDINPYDQYLINVWAARLRNHLWLLGGKRREELGADDIFDAAPHRILAALFEQDAAEMERINAIWRKYTVDWKGGNDEKG